MPLAASRPSHPKRQGLPSDALQLGYPLHPAPVIDRPMAATPDRTQEAIAAMWTNELGGTLMARLLDELHGSKTPLEEEAALYEASKQKFLTAGKTALEHRLWRQKNLKLLRLRYLEHLTWQINPDHPRYKNEEEDELAENWPRLHEPKITLEELDTEVTDWHLLKGMDTAFGFAEELESTAKASSTVEKSIKESSDAWMLIDEEELEGEEMTAEQVRLMIQSQQNIKSQSIKDRLEEAQSNASKFSRANGDHLPVRIHRKSEELLHWFAMTKLGRPGRPPKGGSIDNYTGSWYKLIKGSPFGEAASQPSDEHQQE
jgi:hypothetical protein